MKENPIYRTTVWLYLRDVEDLERIYGRGWSSQVREIIHRHLRERRARATAHNGAYDEHDQ
jgi:hypothetical protein